MEKITVARIYYNELMDAQGVHIQGRFFMGPVSYWDDVSPQALGGAGWVFICEVIW